MEIETTQDRKAVSGGDEFAIMIAPAAVRGGSGISEYVVAVDASASMTWPAAPASAASRWDLARAGLIRMVERLGGSHIHVYLFDGRVSHVASGAAATLRGKLGQQLPTRIDGNNGTNIGEALDTAYRRLAGSTATSRRLILLTDGEPTVGVIDHGRLVAVAQRAAHDDLYTDAIGYGAEANIDLLLGLSRYGQCQHVRSNGEGATAVDRFLTEIVVWGKDMTASGGQLRVRVHPAVAVAGVYQVYPRQERILSAGTDGDFTLTLGAMGDHDRRPAYVFRLRAPEGLVTQGPVAVLRATGEIRTRSGVETLGSAEVAVTVVRHRKTPKDPELLRQVDGIDLEAETAERLRTAAADEHPTIIRQARDRARDLGSTHLVQQYTDSLTSLEAGLHANDVRNYQRAASSRGQTKPLTLLRRVPLMPVDAPVLPTVDDDDDDPTSAAAAPATNAPAPTTMNPVAQAYLDVDTEAGR